MNIRRLIIAAVTVFLLGTLFTAGSQSLAVAKNKSDTASSFNKNVSELPPEMVGKRANELLSRINDSIASLKRYDNKMEGASAEDRLVLQLQGASIYCHGVCMARIRNVVEHKTHF